jgi:energy-coupling factor transporter ATP-binding protein EcfA2
MSTQPTYQPLQPPSTDIQQHLKGNNNQSIGKMNGGNAFGTVEGSISIIYNYYYREDTQIVPIESIGAADDNLPCPYRGLFHFGPNDADVFFGREVFVQELFAATQKRNFIPVLGASGSGKSSVVLAGLVPKLQKEGNWLFTHFRPGSDPFHALAEALVPLYTSGDSTTQIIQARKLAQALGDSVITLHDILSHIQRLHPNHRLLLIADQFEELYTLCTEQKIRRSFLDTLLASFQSSPSITQYNNVLVATMRADFLGDALSIPQFGDLLRNTDVKIRSMNHEELSQVIEKPAEKLGVGFETALVKRILDDVKDEPGNLPLLEFALTQLWKRRKGKQLTHTAYEEIGKVQGALARHASENYCKLSATEQEQVRRIFIQLVRPGEGTDDTRRLATKAELSQASWGLVKHLADARLVVTSRNAADLETVEVVHEALIRNWGELRQWMDADRSFRTWQEQLRMAMRTWESSGFDEGALLRGKPLADAEDWQGKRFIELSSLERSFIGLSVEKTKAQATTDYFIANWRLSASFDVSWSCCMAIAEISRADCNLKSNIGRQFVTD